MSKELYNRCNYLIRQSWFGHSPFPNIGSLLEYSKDLDCFKNLHNTKTAKQTLWRLLSDWTNFKKALNAFKKDPSKFIKCPKPPYYKDKLAQVVFYNETIRRGKKIVNKITPTNDCFSIKSNIKDFKQVVITPKTFGFIIEVSYEKEVEKPKLDKKKVCSIDIGVNTLAAITSDQHDPILINGRIIKSINQWFNKNRCKSRSKKRYFRIENYFHHASKFIINNCIKHQIGTIIIGKNDGWKQNTKKRMRREERQHFQLIPFFKFLQKIEYKSKMVGINVKYTEEAYTSQSSFIDRDPLPKFDETPPEFSGKRVHRGLYQAKDGRLLNADVNGSANICRKIIQDPEFLGRLNRSLAARPLIINPLKDLSQIF